MEAKTDTETEQVLSEDKDDRPGKTDKDSGELEDKTDDEGTKEQKSPKITEYNDSEAEITPFEKQRAEESIMAEAEDVDDIDGRNSDAEIKSKDDASIEKPLDEENKKPTTDKEEASRGNEDQEEDGDIKEDILAEEAEINANDASLGKLLSQNNETPKEVREEASQGSKDQDKDGDEVQTDKEEMLTEAGQVDDGSYEKPPHQNIETPTEDRREASQKRKDADKIDGDEEEADKGDILTEAEDDDDIDKLKGDDRISHDDRNSKDVTEGEAGRDKKGLDRDNTEYEVKQKEEKPVIHKEDEAHKPLDDHDEVATETRETEKINQKDEKPEDYAECEVEPEFESKLSDANELKMNIKPSHESPKEDEILKRNEQDENGDENLAVSEDIQEYDRLSDKSDGQSQTAEEEDEELSFQRSKGFVNEIPELSDEKGKEDNLVALESLNDLYAEKEQLNDELKQVDSQLKELAATGNDKLEDLNKRLDDEELNLLHSLGEIDKHLKKNDNKELMEHLLKEKEDVCTKLDEINNLLNEQKEAMAELGSKDVHTVPGLMCKKDVLKDDLSEKERQLSYKSKMLEAAKKASGKEKENLETSLNSLTAQLAALEDGMRDSDNDAFPYRPKESNKELPSEIVSLVKSKADAENESEKLEKEIKKTENDIGRYGRILEEQRDRLQPFQRKRARIEDSLDWASKADEITSKASEEDIEDGVEDPVYDKSENDALLTDKTDLVDDVEAISERHLEIEKKIEELDFAISNLELPYVLEQELTKDIPTAEKVGIVHQVMDRAEEDLECLEANIVEEQSALREAGFSDPIRLTQHLQEKEKLKKDIDKLDNYQSAMTGSKDEVDHPEVKQLESLLLQKESLEEKAHKLDGEISDEQRNFLEARQFKSTGKVNAESESNIKELIDTKDTSGKDLQETNEKILQTLSTGGLKGPQAEFIEECVERKVRLEDEIDKLQDKIDDETVRAAEMLRPQRLFTQERKELHQKQKEREETVKEKAESVAEAKRREQDPDEVEDALGQVIREKISVDEKLQKIIEYENDGRGRTLPLTFRKHEERLTEARNPEQDPGQVNDNLDHDHVIGEKTIQTLQDENDGSETTIPALKAPHAEGEADTVSENRHSDENLDEKRRELEDNLREIENRLYNLLPSSGPSDGLETGDLENIKSLAAEKVKLEEDIQQAKLLEDLLNEKEALLQEKRCGKDANKDGRERKTQLGGELKKLNELTERRENELQKIETKMDDKKKKLQQLNDDKEKTGPKIGTSERRYRKGKERSRGFLSGRTYKQE
ncbi:hypothetical protein OS493_035904 [Desmophyllum pertusum]|uniref:Uncharacterized protein n=1 Tax=Desmophyllum pertusum TaxID=174260 RepID=A0A9X0CVW8_9CNID|nr:hypothetical protein OS493_035904 [Desmophyllum pertusum]